jgi:Zinc finger C-x8-C-x5-C-x3-H type (and similar)
MDSAGTFNSNTRTGIETRFWLSEDSSVLIGALKKLVSKNISLATIFKCQPVSLTVARYYIENTSGVPMHNIIRVLSFDDVRQSDFHWGRRACNNSTNEPAKELSNSDSCYVTLTYRSIGSQLPRENFKIEVLTMIGNITQISVNRGFVYSNEPTFISREINNYKKTTCRYWNETQSCKYGASCTFAHGDHDRSLNPTKALLRNPFFRTKMCRSVHRKEQCSRGQECNYAHSTEELVIENMQSAVPEQLPQKESVLLPALPVTIINHTAPKMAEGCTDSCSHDAMHTLDDKMDMIKGSEEVEENDDSWTRVTSPNSCKPSVHLASPAHIPNPFALLDDESSKAHATAAHTVSAETEIDKDEPAPQSSIEAIVSPSSKFLKGLVPSPASHVHLIKALPVSKSNRGQLFQCHKCKGTFTNVRVRNFAVSLTLLR